MAAASGAKTTIFAALMVAPLLGACLLIKHFRVFGPFGQYAYFGMLTVVIALFGFAAASSAYYGFRASPEAANYPTEKELDWEARTRSSAAFETGALRGLFVIGIPGFAAWVLAHFVI
jgi:hypothetical protein